VGEDSMPEIAYQELVITCEACQTVKKFSVKDYDQCLKIFRDYKCPNGCGRNLYSFFTVGRLKKKTE
jgi:hypothetical protein